MTYEEILAIVQDHTRTPFQKAADIHATLQTARIDSQKPVQARKVRKIKPQLAGEKQKLITLDIEAPQAGFANGMATDT